MIDYNVRDDWPADTPEWLKSLVSALDRRHGRSNVLPLTVVVVEVMEWLALASGVDAWKNSANRMSLRYDLDESVRWLGATLRAHIAVPLAQFQGAFTRLVNSPAAVLKQPPGSRADTVWTDLRVAGRRLLETLDSDESVRANWDDLVATACDRTLEGREYRPLVELLHDQLGRRGLRAEWIFRDLVSVLAFGREPGAIPFGEKDRPLEERIETARVHVATRAVIEPTVVWLGYQGRTFLDLSAGRVTFMDAHWAVPNAEPEGQDFEYKAELWELVKHGSLFKVAKHVDEESDVDFLVRVDLGTTTAADAADRAVRTVDTILDISIHKAGGIRPHLAQYGVLGSGRAGSQSFMVSQREAGFPDDHYGADMTARAIEEHGPRIASALSREDLPRFLSAAIEVQVTADYPFSRSMAMRRPSEADIRSVIPLADRVVQHIAAYAAVAPSDLFALLGERWPHARWLADVQRAVHMCLLGGGSQGDLIDELTRQLFASDLSHPWLLFVADRSVDLLLACRVESERGWISQMLSSVSDHAGYSALIDGYVAEGAVLEARRGRARNALVHGNPAGFAVVESVREYAEFLSGAALSLGLESYVEGRAPTAVFGHKTDELMAMTAGQDAASYWRARLATQRAPGADSA